MNLKKAFYQKRWVSRLFFLAAFILLWEASAKLSGISPLLLPPVERVAAALWTGFIAGTLLLQTLFSLGLILLAMLISVLLALMLGILSRLSPFALRFADTLTVLAHPLPGMALLPLIIIWFGMGTPAVLAVIVHACLWPLYISLQSGMQNAPNVYTDLGRNFSMGRVSIILEILLPAALSEILSGLRIGWARAWRALISAEMVFGAVGSMGGLGWYIFKRRAMMDAAGLFAGILVVAAVGMAMEGLLFERLEKATLLKWRGAGEKEGKA